MPTVGTTSKPAYVYDAGTDTWVPVGVGAHTHDTSALVSVNNHFAAGKNKIINGDFGIWQRGTTSATAGGWNFFADRWQTYNYGGTYSPSRQTFTPGAAPISGYEGQYFLRINCTATYSTVATTVEDVRTLAGQTATVSLWAKSNTSGPLKFTFAQGFGTGGSAAVDIITQQTTIGTLSTSWQRFTFTTNIPSISGKTIGPNSHLFLQFFADASKDLDIWGVQLEAGPIATPFTTHTGSIQGELAACQRYYFRFNADNDQLLINSGFANSTTAASGRIQFPVPMRTIPTSLDSANLKFGNYAGSGYAMTSVGFNQTSNIGAQVYGTVSGVTAGHAGAILGSSNGAYVGFNAEL